MPKIPSQKPDTLKISNKTRKILSNVFVMDVFLDRIYNKSRYMVISKHWGLYNHWQTCIYMCVIYDVWEIILLYLLLNTDLKVSFLSLI